jgi:transposase
LEEIGKKVSKYTLQNILKTAGFSWRRVRKSMKSQRDEQLFVFFKQEIAHLLQMWQAGEISLWFYDETSIDRNPSSVYAWLPKGSKAYLPAQRGNVMTLSGFFQTDNTLQAYACQGSMNSDLFIAYVEDFLKQYPPSLKTVVVMDNASFHKSAMVMGKIKQWRKQNLFIQFLPPYCSELNAIETLWHHIKHCWLEIKDYLSAQTLSNAVEDIIRNIKTKYTITFT